MRTALRGMALSGVGLRSRDISLQQGASLPWYYLGYLEDLTRFEAPVLLSANPYCDDEIKLNHSIKVLICLCPMPGILKVVTSSPMAVILGLESNLKHRATTTITPPATTGT